jgi:hypothetical protein
MNILIERSPISGLYSYYITDAERILDYQGGFGTSYSARKYAEDLISPRY